MVVDYELLVERFYRTVLCPGDLAVDVGAHTGRHAFVMAECVSGNGRVECFEPLEECRVTFRADPRFAALTGVINLNAYAIGEFSGSSDFVVAQDLLAYSGLKERTYDAQTRLARVSVDVRRLDDLFPNSSRRVAYIKVDTEGGEVGVFRGAGELIARDRPFVSFEFGMNSAKEYKITPEDMFAIWHANNYRVTDILLRPLDRAAFSLSAHQQNVWDYLGIPEERLGGFLQAFRERWGPQLAG
jgi:FkbM family methyltransferase